MKSVFAFFSDSRVWIGASALGWLASIAALVGSNQTIAFPNGNGIVISGGPGLVHFVVALAGLLATIFILRRRWRARLAVLVPVLICVGLFASLLYRDDYSGGSCGPEDWSSGHLHAGYPYSWMDGFICFEHGYTIREYLSAHPEKQSWQPDFLALGVDALFWLNAALIAAAPFAVFSKKKIVSSPP